MNYISDKFLAILLSMFICLPAFSQKKMTDMQITDEIEYRFEQYKPLAAQNIEVSTNEGIVILDGNVNHILAKDEVIKITKAIKGVRGVIDRVEVYTPEVNDEELISDVNYALISNPATESFEIQVEANNGHVQLEGDVNSWQEKQLAERIVKGTKGVKSVQNDLIFEWEEDRPDMEIRQDIEERLKADFRVYDGMIEVEVDDGDVTLSGVVGSADEKDRAEIDAWVANVNSVDISNLEVRPWVDDDEVIRDKFVERTDQEIKRSVEDALFYDARVNAYDIKTMVTNGKVKLRGNVDHLRAKTAAEKDARNIVGVWKVENLINVTPPNVPTDAEITANIEKRIKRDPFLEHYEVNVRSFNGQVYLRGRVETAFEKERAEYLASEVPGVIDVHNYALVMDQQYNWYSPDADLTTLSEINNRFTAMEDVNLETNIADELWWSPFVDREDIKIDVNNGVAHLNGVVDSYREKVYAEYNAFEAGALEVKNNLIIE